MVKENENKKVGGIISIAIHTALIIVVSLAISYTIGFLPPVIVILPLLYGVIDGLIYMMMLNKNQVSGSILISGIIFALIFYGTAPDGIMFWGTVAGSILGEIFYNLIGKDKLAGKMISIITLFVGLAVGEYIPFVFLPEKYLDMYRSYSMDLIPIIEKCINMINIPIMILMVGLTVPCCILGCLWGNKIAKRNKK